MFGYATVLRSMESKPYIPGRHFVMARHEELAERILHYLTDTAARAAIVEEGYRAAHEEFAMERSLKRILQFLAEHRKKGGSLVRTALDSGRAEIRA